MLHQFFAPGAWFAPKRYGYGAGLPIAWQGWVLLASYALVAAGCSLIMGTYGPRGLVAGGMLLVAATLVLILIARKRTSGGWRWRWGERD